ncbi:hypothetical protein OIO90_003727 [Microbotryomycetes sp. JL221]|nr:hypothetical protein OIO90_003727 [Microbotryomycetes sp. JL221]
MAVHSNNKDDDDDDYVDFDDPRFLVDAVVEPETMTYADRRRKQVGRGRDAARANQTMSRHQKELEARERGLSTSLFDKQAGSHSPSSSNNLPTAASRSNQLPGDSAALRMMKNMGFKPGEALGRKRRADDTADIGTNDNAGANVSSSSSHLNLLAAPGASARPTEARTEPLKFEIREKRTGLGVPQPKRARVWSNEQTASSTDTQLPPEQVEQYLDSVRANMDERKAHGYLRSLRRTCEELDRRNGIDDSPMWKDPEELEREQDQAIRRLAFIRDDDDDDVENSDSHYNQGRLSYEKGLSSTVVEEDEEEAELDYKGKEDAAADEEQREWFAMDVRTRLGHMLRYLRSKYHYCFWCGVAYNDAQDLADNCPGELEDDH